MEFLKTYESDNLTNKISMLSDGELLSNINHPAQMVKTFVLREIGLRGLENKQLWKVFKEEIQKPENRSRIIRGLITVSNFVLGEIAAVSGQAKIEVAHLIQKWSNEEKENFYTFLGERLEVVTNEKNRFEKVLV